LIYLDSAATTPMADVVLEAMMPWLKDNYYNAGSVYKKGREAKAAIEKARGQVAKMFNSDPENIIFTSGGSEGNSFVFQAAAERLEASEKKHILVSSVEHDSVLRAAESLTKRGFHVDYLPVSECGTVLYETVKQAITPETGLISIMLMNNETGAINHLDFIARLCQERGILLHSDCVQAAGIWKINIEDVPLDFATISAHKFHGPKGVGCVYIRDPEECHALIQGGHNQEFGLRGGTENVAGIVGMGVAAETILDNLDYIQETVWNYRYLFWNIINERLEGTVRINGQWPALSKVLNIRVDGIDADTFVVAMDAAGVCLSAGSACRSLELEPSHVLTAMGLSPDEARSSVRVSFSGLNTELQVRDAAKIFANTVNVLRGSCL
jgi:cysteine desulfurase